MFDEICKLIETVNGLEITFKVGKESELNIKGDFLTMAKMATIIAAHQSEESKFKTALHGLQAKG
jgi:hypothetical protein